VTIIVNSHVILRLLCNTQVHRDRIKIATFFCFRNYIFNFYVFLMWQVLFGDFVYNLYESQYLINL